ncbi:MAG: hypothetical protein ABW196_09030 [Solirubrobacterales bacterium]
MPNRLPVLFVLLLLSGLLLAAAGAQGASAAPVASSSALEEDFEGFEEELEEEESEEEAVEAECETAREEADEGELGLDEVGEICAEAAETGKRKKGAGSSSVAPPECLLRSAHAHAAVNATGDKLKLTIGYTTYEPVGAKVEVRKGSSRIAAKRLRLGRSGVLRIVEDLGKKDPPKLVLVRLAVPASPGYCGKYETEKVRVS